MEKIKIHRDLNVYKLSFEAGMAIYRISKSFPKEELYSLTDQIRSILITGVYNSFCHFV
jgi:hypothetical protein